VKKGTPKGAYPGLTKRPETGLFQFKLDLPKDVRDAFGKRFVVVSLGTEDRKAAIERWAPLHADWRDKIRQVRSGTLRNITDHIASEIALDLIEHDEPYSDGPSKYSHASMTLSEIADLVQADLDERKSIIDIDGSTHHMADLTQADRQAVVLAVQEQIFQRLNITANKQQAQALQAAVRARTMKPADSGAKSATVYLLDAFAIWKANAGARIKSARDFKASCSEFIAINGDLPVPELIEEHFAAYKTFLYTTTNKKKGENFGKHLNQNTRNKKMGGIKAVIGAAIEAGIIKTDPSANVIVPKGAKSKKRVHGLFDDEIKAIFASPVYTQGYRPKRVGEAAYWVPVLAFFTGARQGELCQLNVADVVVVNGVKCLRIVDSEDQHVKTDSSYRVVPLAQKVIDLGFNKYVAGLDPKGRLFPAVKPDVSGTAGANFSKWYNPYRRTIGVVREGSDFHAIRHLVKTELRGSTGDNEAKLQITGHSSGTESAKYGQIPVKEMKQIVDQLQYDVVIPPWKPGKDMKKRELKAA